VQPGAASCVVDDGSGGAWDVIARVRVRVRVCVCVCVCVCSCACVRVLACSNANAYGRNTTISKSKTRGTPLGGDTPSLRLGACFSRRARTPAWGAPTCQAAWLRRLTVIQGDLAAVASGCVTSDGLLHPMACIEAAEGRCALRLADIVFSSVRNCAALGEMGREDSVVVARIRTQTINGGFNLGMEFGVWLSWRNGQLA
jgi:hypothetical protein